MVLHVVCLRGHKDTSVSGLGSEEEQRNSPERGVRSEGSLSEGRVVSIRRSSGGGRQLTDTEWPTQVPGAGALVGLRQPGEGSGGIHAGASPVPGRPCTYRDGGEQES